ncbi:MAG: MobF family relaxase, partial [bacterium]
MRISQQNSAKEAKRYYTTADYYSQGQETVGLWGGLGAQRLGLSGQVDQPAFEQLCDNIDPNSGEPLTVRTRRDRTIGYDFTFSVPKSISLVYGLTGDESILRAFREAVDETMREIESEMQTRVRTAGRDENRPTGNLIWAEFIHTTSRPVDGVPDPHLHAHLFVFNTTYDDKENRWKAGQFREIKRDAPYFQAAFRVRLANKLQDLGYGVTRKRDDFELKGLPADLLKRFSRRTTMIDDLARERGIDAPDEKALLGAESRERKRVELSLEDLRKDWLGRLSQAEIQAVEEVVQRIFSPEQGEPQETMA